MLFAPAGWNPEWRLTSAAWGTCAQKPSASFKLRCCTGDRRLRTWFTQIRKAILDGFREGWRRFVRIGMGSCRSLATDAMNGQAFGPATNYLLCTTRRAAM